MMLLGIFEKDFRKTLNGRPVEERDWLDMGFLSTTAIHGLKW